MIIEELKCAECKRKLIKDGKQKESFILVCNNCLGYIRLGFKRKKDILKLKLKELKKMNKKLIRGTYFIQEDLDKIKKQEIFLNELLDEREDKIRKLLFTVKELKQKIEGKK